MLSEGTVVRAVVHRRKGDREKKKHRLAFSSLDWACAPAPSRRDDHDCDDRTILVERGKRDETRYKYGGLRYARRHGEPIPISAGRSHDVLMTVVAAIVVSYTIVMAVGLSRAPSRGVCLSPARIIMNHDKSCTIQWRLTV